MKKNLKFIFLFICSLSILKAETKIMPLGDSLTWDWHYNDIRTDAERSGYRNYLWYKLKDAGYSIDFVGSQTNGGAINPYYDGDNDGYTGITSHMLAGKIYTLLDKNTPDIILLHIGTNDVLDYSSFNTLGVEKILNEVDRFEKNSSSKIKVILAKIIKLESNPSWVSQFNDSVGIMVKKRIDEGDDIVIVDMENEAGLNYDKDMMSDGIHPNNTGYDKIANLWFGALEDALPSNGNLPILADVNNDSMVDIVAFGNKGVSVSLSNGFGFDALSLWLNDFGYEQGWRSDNTLRKMADVDGDGSADIVAFGNNGVSVSLSNGLSFGRASLWISNFGYNQGWRNSKGLRVLADVNGDGKADIVGFGNNGVSVAISNGFEFKQARLWVDDFCYTQGWRNDKGLRFMSDVNGDGKADIVGFGNNGVSVALSNGKSFAGAKRWVDDFGYNQGWRNDKGLRYMSDVNGDGKADIVGFGNNGVSVALSNGKSFAGAKRWVDDFGYNQGWRNDKGLRYMSDVNGDGKADIVGFGNSGVSVALSTGSSFIGASRWVDDFGNIQGWNNYKYLRLMADVDGDGLQDVVGFGNKGVNVSTSTGWDFMEASKWLSSLGYDQEGVYVDFTPYQEQQ